MINTTGRLQSQQTDFRANSIFQPFLIKRAFSVDQDQKNEAPETQNDIHNDGPDTNSTEPIKDEKYTNLIEMVKQSSQRELNNPEDPNAVISLETLALISLAIVEIGQAQFNTASQNIKRMRLLCRKINFEEYKKLCLGTRVQYEQIWATYLTIVLNDSGLSVEQWNDGLRNQDLNDPNVLRTAIPIEIMSRSVPLDRDISEVTIENARQLLQFQIDSFDEALEYIQGQGCEGIDLFSVMAAWLSDIGYEKFGISEEHVSAIPNIGQDEEMIRNTQVLNQKLGELIPPPPADQGQQ